MAVHWVASQAWQAGPVSAGAFLQVGRIKRQKTSANPIAVATGWRCPPDSDGLFRLFTKNPFSKGGAGPKSNSKAKVYRSRLRAMETIRPQRHAD